MTSQHSMKTANVAILTLYKLCQQHPQMTLENAGVIIARIVGEVTEHADIHRTAEQQSAELWQSEPVQSLLPPF